MTAVSRSTALLVSSGGVGGASAALAFAGSATIIARRPQAAASALRLASGVVQLRGWFALSASADLALAGAAELRGRVALAASAALAFSTPGVGTPLVFPGRARGIVRPALRARTTFPGGEVLMPYTTQETAELVLTLDDATGQLYDADTLTVRLRPPAGPDLSFSLAAGTVARVSLGTYRIRRILSVPGVWIYEWIATRGSLVAEDAGAIRVTVGPFGA